MIRILEGPCNKGISFLIETMHDAPKKKKKKSLSTESFAEHMMTLLLLEEPCCVHVNKYRHIPKQYDECYQENCQVLST